jgi:hypothetical protein
MAQKYAVFWPVYDINTTKQQNRHPKTQENCQKRSLCLSLVTTACRSEQKGKAQKRSGCRLVRIIYVVASKKCGKNRSRTQAKGVASRRDHRRSRAG